MSKPATLRRLDSKSSIPVDGYEVRRLGINQAYEIQIHLDHPLNPEHWLSQLIVFFCPTTQLTLHARIIQLSTTQEKQCLRLASPLWDLQHRFTKQLIHDTTLQSIIQQLYTDPLHMNFVVQPIMSDLYQIEENDFDFFQRLLGLYKLHHYYQDQQLIVSDKLPVGQTHHIQASDCLRSIQRRQQKLILQLKAKPYQLGDQLDLSSLSDFPLPQKVWQLIEIRSRHGKEQLASIELHAGAIPKISIQPPIVNHLIARVKAQPNKKNDYPITYAFDPKQQTQAKRLTPAAGQHHLNFPLSVNSRVLCGIFEGSSYILGVVVDYPITDADPAQFKQGSVINFDDNNQKILLATQHGASIAMTEWGIRSDSPKEIDLHYNRMSVQAKKSSIRALGSITHQHHHFTLSAKNLKLHANQSIQYQAEQITINTPDLNYQAKKNIRLQANNLNIEYKQVDIRSKRCSMRQNELQINSQTVLFKAGNYYVEIKASGEVTIKAKQIYCHARSVTLSQSGLMIV